MTSNTFTIGSLVKMKNVASGGSKWWKTLYKDSACAVVIDHADDFEWVSLLLTSGKVIVWTEAEFMGLIKFNDVYERCDV